MFDLALKASVVRNHFSEVVDDVIRREPKVVNRHRDHFVMINFDHVSAFVDELNFNARVIQDDDGSFLATLAEIDGIIGEGATEDSAVSSLVSELIEYSYEYLRDNFSLYFNAPNRKKHFPYVFKVMMQKSSEDIMKFVHVEHQES